MYFFFLKFKFIKIKFPTIVIFLTLINLHVFKMYMNGIQYRNFVTHTQANSTIMFC